MEFKIDTKDTFTIIMPLNGSIDANLTGELHEKCVQMRQSGSANYIVDFQNCTDIAEIAIADLIELHEECYGNGQSLVFTGMNSLVVSTLKKHHSEMLINIAPSMQEAIDIVSMEILERDLYNEE